MQMIGFAAQNAMHALISIIVGALPANKPTIDQLECLAQNIWFETRNGTFEDKIAVGNVVINRVSSEIYPDSICEVVWQPKQFSWTHDGYSDIVKINNAIDRNAWMESVLAAHFTINGSLSDFSNGATHYHADYVAPNWRLLMNKVATHGRHIYYRDENVTVNRAGTKSDTDDIQTEIQARMDGFWTNLGAILPKT